MRVYKKIMDVIAGIEKVVLSAVLVFVTVITFANVLVRKLSDSQFAWTEELVINLFVLMIMLGCALGAREGSLISLSLIFDRLKGGGKKVFVLIITAANTVFWVILLKTGIDKVLTQIANGKHTFSLNWPEWVFTIFLPIGCVFLILHTIEFCIDTLTDNVLSVKPDEKEEGGND
ncbi:putative transporter [Oscillibacter valericigenes Sjm18-20]|nr:putative transporter [Oscillibacter valericigenes Sjm18-20]